MNDQIDLFNLPAIFLSREGGMGSWAMQRHQHYARAVGGMAPKGVHLLIPRTEDVLCPMARGAVQT